MKFSEFSEEKRYEIGVKAMPLIIRLKYNPKTIEYMKSIDKDVKLMDLFSVMLQNEPKAGIELFAMLNGQEVSEFEYTAVTIAETAMNAFLDDDLMRLFGLRVQTPTTASSGLAVENTEA